MDDILITDLFPVQFHEHEILARPYQFNDSNNPTEITRSHTTCPNCGNCVEIDHTNDDNFIEKDGIRYTFCKNCEYGQYYFNSLKQWIYASESESNIIPDSIIDFNEFKFDITMLQTVNGINWELTNLLNNE